MGGIEDQEGLLQALCLGPLIASYARRQLRVAQSGTFLDPGEVEFFATMVVNFMEALDGITPRHYPRTPAEANLGPNGASDLESRQYWGS